MTYLRQQSRAANFNVRLRPEDDDLAELSASASSSTTDPDTSNNVTTDSLTVSPRHAELSLGISAIPDPALAGAEFTIQAVVTNMGPDAAYSPPNGDGVNVDLELPPELQVLSVSPGPGTGLTAPFCNNSYLSDRHVRCKWPTLVRDQSVAADIRAKAVGQGSLEIRGSVTSNGYAECCDSGLVTRSVTLVSGYTLSVTKPGNGSGKVTSDKPGIACGTNCSYPYATGTQVKLTAVADGGSTFVGWTGDGAPCALNSTCTMNMDAPHAVGANFKLNVDSASSSASSAAPTTAASTTAGPAAATSAAATTTAASSATAAPGRPPPPPPPAFCLVPDVIGLREAAREEEDRRRVLRGGEADAQVLEAAAEGTGPGAESRPRLPRGERHQGQPDGEQGQAAEEEAETQAQAEAEAEAEAQAQRQRPCAASALDDPDRDELGNPAGEARARHDVDDSLDVLVGERRFLGEPLVRGAADDDPASLELAAELCSLDPLARAGSAHAGDRRRGRWCRTTGPSTRARRRARSCSSPCCRG